MKIEVGKRYLTRDGRVAEITEIYPLDENGSDPYSYPVRGKLPDIPVASWTREGMELEQVVGQGSDLVAEIDEAADAATFDEAPQPGLVKAGGCAPPVMVDGPAVGDRPIEITPMVHAEVPPPEPPPVLPSLRITLLGGASRELQMMFALEQLMAHFEHATSPQEKDRATAWLKSRHELPF